MKVLLFGCFFALSSLLLIARGQQPDLVVEAGHSGHVSCVSFSPDGRTVASGSDDGLVKLWDAESGKEIRTFAGYGKHITQISFSPDGKFVAGAGAGIKLWDIATGKVLRSFYGTEFTKDWTFSSVAFSPDGTVLAGTVAGDTYFWNPSTGALVHTLEQQRSDSTSTSYDNVVFSSDGKRLATVNSIIKNGTEEHSISIWDAATLQQLRTLAQQSEIVHSIDFSPDGKTLAVIAGKTVEMWNLNANGENHLEKKEAGAVFSVAFSPDGTTLAVAIDNGVTLLKVSSGTEIRKFGSESFVSSVAFSRDGKALATGNWSNSVRIWNLDTGLAVQTSTASSEHTTSLSLSPDGRFLAAGRSAGTISAWNLTSGRPAFQVREADSLGGYPEWVNRIYVAFSPDGKSLATGQHHGHIRLLDSSTGKEIREFRPPIARWISYGVNSLAFSPDGTLLATGGDASVDLWDVTTGSYRLTLDGPGPSGHETSYLSFRPGKTLLGWTDWSDRPSIKLWDVMAAKENGRLDPNGSPVVMSADGAMLAVGNFFSYIQLTDVATGKEIRILPACGKELDACPGKDKASVLSFSPSAAILASGNSEGTIRLWNTRTGSEMQMMPGGNYNLEALSFSVDEKTLASGGAGPEIRLWDVSTGRMLGEIVLISEGRWVVTTPDGRFDASDLDELQGLHWVFPDDPFRTLPPEVFMRDYYEPGILARLLKREPLQKIRPLAELNRVQPGVKIVSVKRGASPDLASVTVEVSPREGQLLRGGKPVTVKTDVYDLRLFREGQLVGQDPQLSPVAEARLKNGVVLTAEDLKAWQTARKVKAEGMGMQLDPSTGKLQRTFTVRLAHSRAGADIEFTAYAFNEDRVKSQTAKVTYHVPNNAGPSKKRAYVVAMGVNAYENPGWDLKFAASDALILRDALVQRLRDQYEVVPVTLISDCKQPGCPKDASREIGVDHASKASLQAAIELLAGHTLSDALAKSIPPGGEHIRKAEPDDLVVFSLSSHGYTSKDGMFYIVPSDSGEAARGVVTSEVLQKWISSDELSAWLRDIDAGENVMVVDTCHSAATVDEPGFKPGPMGNRGLGQLAYDKGMRILAASQADDVALESEKLKQGLLTYALVHDGLEAKQAAAGNGQITLDSWLVYGSRRVPVLYEEVVSGRVQTFTEGSKDVTVVEQPSPRTGPLDKLGTFQQPSLFDFQKRQSAVTLSH